VFVPTRVLLDNILAIESTDHAGATHPLLALALIGLYQQDFTPTVDSVLTDFTEANYNTYARIAAAPYSAVFVGEGVLSLVDAVPWHVQMTDNLAPQTIYGALLIAADGTTLLGAERFDAPENLATVLNAFDYILRFGLDPLANFGLGVLS